MYMSVSSQNTNGLCRNFIQLGVHAIEKIVGVGCVIYREMDVNEGKLNL